jgi:hypothetical protein
LKCIYVWALDRLAERGWEYRRGAMAQAVIFARARGINLVLGCNWEKRGWGEGGAGNGESWLH